MTDEDWIDRRLWKKKAVYLVREYLGTHKNHIKKNNSLAAEYVRGFNCSR